MTMMVGLMVLGAVAVAVVTGVVAWRASASRFPSDGTLRQHRPDVAQPLIREQSRHHDTPAGADLDLPGGREHRR